MQLFIDPNDYQAYRGSKYRDKCTLYTTNRMIYFFISEYPKKYYPKTCLANLVPRNNIT